MTATLDLEYELDREGFRFDVALRLPLVGVTGIFGRSGAGKTTLLRLIAGLEQPPSGSLQVAGETWHDSGTGTWLSPHERNVGYVFQEPRLFPHLPVRGNLLYGFARQQPDRRQLEFDHVVDLLGLGPLLDREPAALSGGEAQRVAIGRALLRSPSLVLMDEPLATLDVDHKDDILPFLDRLHAELEMPILYVSHNIDEISRLCDRLVVIDAGRIAAEGELQDVLVRLDVPLLRGREAGSVVAGTVADYDTDYELRHIRFPGGELRVPGRHGETGKQLRLRINASDVSLCRERPRNTTILNILHATIDAIEETSGATRLVRLSVGDDRLLARVTRRSCDELGLAPGESIEAQIKAVAVREP